MTIKKIIRSVTYKPLALLVYPLMKFLGWLDEQGKVSFREYWKLVTGKHERCCDDDD